MTDKKFRELSPLEQKCTLCNKDLVLKDIVENNYIEVYKKYRYRLAHKVCYNKLIKRW